MITLISTPEYIKQVAPEVISRWVATESPVNFRLLRQDYPVLSAANNGGYLRLTVAAASFDGFAGDQIAVYNRTLDAMYTGEVQAGSTSTIIDTDILFISGFDPTDTALDSERDYAYFNDNTLHGGYYFEGRLTMNGVQQELTIITSPDSYGYADLDVSGILRIETSVGKIGDYSDMIIAETNKSGNFYLEYRQCWYGSDNEWILSEGTPETLYYYAEAVRSEEQGSNLYEFVADDYFDAPFFNAFESPVFFSGYPFDISFIMPERLLVSPDADLQVTIRSYNSSNTLLSEYIYYVEANSFEGRICSLTIEPENIAEGASYLTAEILAA